MSKRRVATVKITRVLYDDGGLVDTVEAFGTDGEGLPLVESLGMLRLAEHTLIADAKPD
jgi:hypothetical protein